MKQETKTFDKKLLAVAIKDSFIKLNPRLEIKNPVMFIVFIGAIITTLITFTSFTAFNIQISIWLWFTVLFANFSEAVAEGRGKAQAEALKKMRTNTYARLLSTPPLSKGAGGIPEKQVLSSELKVDDLVVCETGDLIPSDGEVVEGIASVDESAITGESAPVIRESGGDRSAVTGGTKVISDRIIIKITSEQGNTFLDKMIALVEGAKRHKTPNEIALTILLSGMSIIFLLAVVTLKPFELFALSASGNPKSTLTVPVLISLLVCLIPTTIGGLLSAIGISGIDRLTKRNVIAKSGKAVEAAGDVDVLLLDKTGTITLGNRMATEFIPVKGVEEIRLAEIAQLSSLSDETPEGRSIVILAKEKYNMRGRHFDENSIQFVPFTAQTKMSGVDITDKGKKLEIRKGAAEAIKQYILQKGGAYPPEITQIVENIAREGSTPLVVTENNMVLGVIRLKDIVKGGIKERFEQLRRMGIKTVMITGDNPLTAVAIAAEAGVDDFIAEATPEMKLARIRQEQADGKLVAMIGDGTNDAPALAQADVGVAMNTGTQAAREAGNMVDLDSNPTKLIDVVEIGKQLLMTRGSLTTFSIANDVAKYFAILPAIFVTVYAMNGTGVLSKLNIMGLQSPESAILSAVIFNALIIIALIPLALKGVKYQAKSASSVLKRNIFIYGFGGLIVPFIGIKLIDLIITTLHLI
ncbi:MAG: potassium-transporting ATPase subunit KdpB [Candidatus Kapabacteria bacterium]|nr:potassium-transporting ATPase subunit KdpB [Candidatus Kapabacteria bacterium]